PVRTSRLRFSLVSRILSTEPATFATFGAMNSEFRSRSPLDAILLSAWFAAAVAGPGASPTAAPGELPGALREDLKNERLEIVTSIRGLPLGVRDGLQTLFGSQSLDIAEPGVQLQGTGSSGTAKLPMRRLVAAGCSTDHCLVYYERG